MSNQGDPDEKLLAEFEAMLGGLFEEDDEDSVYGISPIGITRRHTSNGESGDSEKDTKVSKKQCKHKKLIKKQLLTSFYFVCEDCGEEVEKAN
jgi:hypothetical protein